MPTTTPTKPCPCCGGVLYREVGVVEYAAIGPYFATVRRTKLAAFYACSSCEHCEENGQ